MIFFERGFNVHFGKAIINFDLAEFLWILQGVHTDFAKTKYRTFPGHFLAKMAKF